MTFQRISPAEALEKMGAGYTYVDVRSPEEFAGGRPAGSINVPLTPDASAFVDAIEARFAKDAKIILGCAAGIRSKRAAQALTEAGFTDVLDQRAGWDAARGTFGQRTEPGWSRCDLPREP